MTELKTLKDLGFSYGKAYTSEKLISLKWKKTAIKQYGEDELREEAIKWIKEISQSRDYPRDKSIGEWGGNIVQGLAIERGFEQNDAKGMIKWIMHFFNITEEELKE